MKVVWTESALADLHEILEFTQAKYPLQRTAVERRIRSVIQRISDWPESGRPVQGRSDVRTVPILRYPFRVFYRIGADRIDLLHIRHTSRRSPEL